jgi:hypothetical protein
MGLAPFRYESPRARVRRINLRAEPEWVAAVEEAARHMGMGLSAYIRLSVNERLSRDRAAASVPEPPPPKRRKGR